MVMRAYMLYVIRDYVHVYMRSGDARDHFKWNHLKWCWIYAQGELSLTPGLSPSALLSHFMLLIWGCELAITSGKPTQLLAGQHERNTQSRIKNPLKASSLPPPPSSPPLSSVEGETCAGPALSTRAHLGLGEVQLCLRMVWFAWLF